MCVFFFHASFFPLGYFLWGSIEKLNANIDKGERKERGGGGKEHDDVN